MRTHGEAERRDPAHRLICEDCRLETADLAAWKRVERPPSDRSPTWRIDSSRASWPPCGATARRDPRAPRAGGRGALLFSFFAGLAHEQATCRAGAGGHLRLGGHAVDDGGVHSELEPRPPGPGACPPAPSSPTLPPMSLRLTTAGSRTGLA
jgi:hypothetical protein